MATSPYILHYNQGPLNLPEDSEVRSGVRFGYNLERTGTANLEGTASLPILLPAYKGHYQLYVPAASDTLSGVDNGNGDIGTAEVSSGSGGGGSGGSRQGIFGGIGGGGAFIDDTARETANTALLLAQQNQTRLDGFFIQTALPNAAAIDADNTLVVGQGYIATDGDCVIKQ